MTYSSSVALGRQRAMGRGKNVTTFRGKEKALGPVSNTIILVVLACMLGLLYLTQVTKTNAYGYKINDLEKQQTELQTEHAELEVNSARLQALERVKNSDVAKSLVTATPTGTVQN